MIARKVAAGFLVCVSGLSAALAVQADGEGEQPTELKQPQVAFEQYASPQSRAAQDPGLSFVVAASGGGHRAGNFTAGVLMALESMRSEENPGRSLLDEVDLFSTVSGGGFAVGAYLSSLHDHLARGGRRIDFSFARTLNEGPCATEKSSRDYREACYARHLERGYHHTLLRGLFAIASAFSRVDRGDFLERRLDDTVLGARPRARLDGRTRDEASLRYRDIFSPAGSRQGDLPLWVPNATVFANGAIFPFSPDQLAANRVVSYTHRLRRQTICWAEPGRPQASDYLDVPLAAGMKASATFPVAVPATTLEVDDSGRRFIHLLDGGLADNLGIWTALDYVNARQRARDAGRTVLLVVDASNSTLSPHSDGEGAPRILGTIRRTMGISLDSWRGRFGRVLEDPDGPVSIVLSFDELVPAVQEISAPGRVAPEVTTGAADRCLVRTPTGAVELRVDDARCRASLEALQRDVRGVGTNLNVSPAQQALLLRAGTLLACSKQTELEKALGVGLTSDLCNDLMARTDAK